MVIRHCLAATLLLFVLLPGCASLVQAPLVTLKEASMVGLDSSGIDLDFNLGITNSNSFDLSLMGYTLDLKVLTLPLSTGGNQETILLPAGKEIGMRLPVRLKFADLIEIIKLSPSPDRIPYQLTGLLHFKTPLGKVIVPVEKNSVLHISEQHNPVLYFNRLRDTLRGNR